jgi:hypothetical protein
MIAVLLLTGSKLLPLVKNVLLTPPDYDRDIRHYEFDLKGTGISYSQGDCLGLWQLCFDDFKSVYVQLYVVHYVVSQVILRLLVKTFIFKPRGS